MDTIENYLTSLISDRDKMIAAIGLPNIPSNITFTNLVTHLEEMGKVHRVSTVAEMNELPNPKQEDICIVTTEHIKVYESGDVISTVTLPDEVEIDFTPTSLPRVNQLFSGVRSDNSSISFSSTTISMRLNFRPTTGTTFNKTVTYKIGEDGKSYKRTSSASSLTFPSGVSIDYSGITDERVLEILHRIFIDETGIFNGIYIYNYGWEHYDVQCYAPADKIFSGYSAYTSHGIVNGTFTFSGKEGLPPSDKAIASLLQGGREDLSYVYENYPYSTIYIPKLLGSEPHYSPIVNIAYMFSNCKNLVDPGTENWDTSQVTNMAGVFSGSPKVNLEKAVGNWNTSNVLDMSNVFRSALLSNAVVPNLVNWNVSNVTNMSGIFYSASQNLVGIGNWNTSNVTDLSYAFAYTNNSSFSDIENWNVSNVTNMAFLFYYTNYYGKNLDLSRWDTSNVTNMADAFGITNSSTSTVFNIENWNVSNVRDLGGAFHSYHSTSIGEIDLTRWNVSNVTSLYYFFPEEHTVNITGWDTSNVTNMKQLFSQVNQGKWTTDKVNAVLNQLNTHNVKDMSSMFMQTSSSYNSWEGLDVSCLDTTSLENSVMMFEYISLLHTINGLDVLDFSNLNTATWMFYNLPALSGPINMYNLVNLTLADGMFYMLPSVNTIEVTNLNNLTNATQMFYQCHNLQNISITGNLSKLDSMTGMFFQCENLRNLSLPWDTLTNVTRVSQMFHSCNNIPLSVLNNFCNALCNMNIPEDNRILNNLYQYSPIYKTNINILSIGVPQATIYNLINNGWSFES